jgi:hypothetical protein
MTRVSRIVDVSFGLLFRFGINRVMTGDKYVVIDLSFTERRLGPVLFAWCF